MDFSELNKAQREAVTETEGIVRVIAGAGSGKTRAIAHRYAFLVQDIGILPANILCVTFTNKAAAEMRQRIRQLTGDNDTGYICTFHSFCTSVLQEDIYALQYPKQFLVLDNADIDAMLSIIYEERGLTLRDMTFAKARDMIEMRKLYREPNYYRKMLSMSIDELRENYKNAAAPEDMIFYGYLYQEKKCFALDYNDLIKFTLYLFEQNPEICRKWQERLEYIMVDEFQDIDEPQYRLMRVLSDYHRNLFIVGDPDQTIYTWRGANVRYLLDFDKEFTPCRTILMTQNYRSTPQILAAANSLVSRNVSRYKKDLLPVLPDGEQVLFRHSDSAESEAKYLVETVRGLLQSGAEYRDIAILYRAHYVTRTIEEAFLQEDIPYRIYSGAQFFDRKEIKDALSYLRMIAYRDDLSFRRICNVPKRNIGEKRMKALEARSAQTGRSLFDTMKASLEDDLFRGTGAADFAALIDEFSAAYANHPVSEVLTALLDRSGYEEMLRTEGSQARLDNLAELKQSVYEYETTCGEECTLEDYLAHVALFTNADVNAQKNAVKLMTVHAAKGLEFPYVFLCSLCEGVFPSNKAKTLPAMEEERRLAFVAMTRAEKALFLSDNEGRNVDGSPRVPSRFVFDIAPEYLHFASELPDSLVKQAKKHIEFSEMRMNALAASPQFVPGDRVEHAIMGEGTVLAVDKESSTYRIQFDDLPTPRKIAWRVKMQALPGDTQPS